MRKIYLLLFLPFLFISCKQRIEPSTPEQLFEKYRSSVVLIKNTFYYEALLSNGTTVYFNQSKDGTISDPTIDEKEAINNATTIFGTGFFITKDGKIVTNKHVAQPTIDQSSIISDLKIKFDNAKFKITEQQSRLSDTINAINSYISYYYDNLSYSDISNLSSKRERLKEERTQLSELGLAFDFEPSKSKIISKSVYLGIAFDNTFVTKESDFKECVLIKTDPSEDVDLALIQLKDKTTPPSITSILDFTDHNPNIKNGTLEDGEQTYNLSKPLKIDTKLYMIGYNYGVQIGNTDDGLKAQLTQGSVSQEADSKRVLYSIPSLPGSSGSPVIDKWGNLVAINFAKVGNTQGFNFGIPALQLKKLLNSEQND